MDEKSVVASLALHVVLEPVFREVKEGTKYHRYYKLREKGFFSS